MFESYGQIYTFLSCFAFGVVFGVLYLLVLLVKSKIKVKIIKIITDLIYFIGLSIFFAIFTKIFRFPSVRFYMPTAVLLGVFSSVKTFNIILAKMIEKIYNIFNTKVKEKL
jgi:hypothetical protein